MVGLVIDDVLGEAEVRTIEGLVLGEVAVRTATGLVRGEVAVRVAIELVRTGLVRGEVVPEREEVVLGIFGLVLGDIPAAAGLEPTIGVPE